MKLIWTLAVALALPVAGCVTTSNLERNSQPPSAEDAVVVIGVKPHYRIALSKGKADGLNWLRNHSSVATTNTFPDDGYVVVKVPANTSQESYGITQILPEGLGGFVPRFMPCTGQAVVAFKASSQQVLYIGDVEYVSEGDKLRLAFSWHPDQARQYLAERHPALLAKLEPVQAEIYSMANTNCGPATIFIPIFRTH